MATLASDWLRHFGLLLWKRWTEFGETWQEARSQCLLLRLCFSGKSGKKQNGHRGLWLAETFSTSPLKPLKGIRRNLIRSKISMHSTKFVFLRWIGKTKCIAMILKHCCFWFHSDVKFLTHSLYSGERQWPFGPLVSQVLRHMGRSLHLTSKVTSLVKLQEKGERSDSVLWQKTLHPQKTSIIQRLRPTGRSVGVATATQLV